jgi:hypothetical protein
MKYENDVFQSHMGSGRFFLSGERPRYCIYSVNKFTAKAIAGRPLLFLINIGRPTCS